MENAQRRLIAASRGARYGQLVDLSGDQWSISMRIKMSRQELERRRQGAMAMFEKGEHPGAK